MQILLTTLNAKYIHSSLALRYLEKYCANDAYEIIVEEYTINDQIDAITANIYKTGADVIAFSCYIWNIGMIVEIADRIKKVKPNCTIIFGGPEVSYDPAERMREYPFIDYIIMGEGEQTLKELLIYIEQGEVDASNIQGLTYRKSQDIIVNPERPLICNFDTIPSPYNTEDIQTLAGKLIYYETSRGCPFNCSYCLSSTIHGVRYFSMERVKADLLLFIKHNVQLVKFVDRTFNANKDRTMELFKFLVQNSKNTSFHFEIAADLIDDNMIEYLSTVPEGLFQFEIGVQSTNVNVITAVDRKMNFNKIITNVQKIRQVNNIHLHLDLIAGLPKEDYQSFAQSFNDVYGLAPHALQLGFLKLLKGSKIRQQAMEYNYKYISIPPYEVLQNNTISYKEILQLKGIEDVLEKYYNSGVFEKALQYILSTFDYSPFEFYQNLALYFEDEGLDKRAHSRKALYDILFEFYQKRIMGKTEIFGQYLKLDFLTHERGGYLPYWAQRIDDAKFREKCFEFLRNEENIKKYLPRYTGMPAKKIIKQVRFEIFDIDVLDVHMQDIQLKETVILFDYNGKKVYDVTNSEVWNDHIE